MLAERQELAALAAVAGPRATPQEINTYAYLAEFTAICEQIAAIPVEERMERVHAVKMGLVRPADAEAVRAAMWLRMPMGVRTVAVMSAGLHKARAEDTLNKFNAFERGRIWVCLDKLIADLLTVQKCMNGGTSAPPNEIDRKAVMNGYPPEVKRTH